jgi:hypothetical protein
LSDAEWPRLKVDAALLSRKLEFEKNFWRSAK